MNRKERRRLEKQNKRQTQKGVPARSSIDSFGVQSNGQTPAKNTSNVLFDHAMNAGPAQIESELSQKLEWELQQISNQLNNGFTGNALKACQDLEARYPNDVGVLELSGIAYFMNQDWPKATQCFEAVLQQNPQNPHALNYLGDLAIEKNALGEAEDLFYRARKILPDDQPTLERLAYVLQRQEKMTEAAEIYRQLIEKDSSSAETHLNYGYALFKSDQFNEAVAEYQRAIKLNPKLGLAHINLGMALSGLDKDENAIEAFRHGLEILPNHIEGLFGLARCLRAQDEYKEAAGSFKKALDLAPDQTEAYWELGYSLELSGDKEGGQKAYETCLAHNPDHSVARHLLDSLLGNTTETAPKDYIQELFDDYADSFDDSLVNELNYVVPKLLNTRLQKINRDHPIRSVLDLGGGTGLVVAEIRNHIDPDSGIIHGIDLSSAMLEISKQKNRYHETFVTDIADFLENSKIGIPHYELIIAGDVFVYIGNLEQVFAGVYQRLEKNGHFLFTVEQSHDENYVLQSTGRYAHRKKYVEELADKFNFDVLDIEEIIPRKDGDTEVKGYLVSLRKH